MDAPRTLSALPAELLALVAGELDARCLALGANPVREKIWPRRFPQSIITTLRNIKEIGTALVDLFWAHLPY